MVRDSELQAGPSISRQRVEASNSSAAAKGPLAVRGDQPNPGTTVQNVAGVQRTLVSDGELELGASDVDAVGHGVRRARAVR